MALYLVLLSTILAFSLTSTGQYVSSPGSSINLSLDSMKNASGHWIKKVDTGRYTMKENLHPLSENVHRGTSNKTGQLTHPSLHDTSMSGAVQPTAAYTSTTNTSSTITTNTSSTITTDASNSTTNTSTISTTDTSTTTTNASTTTITTITNITTTINITTTTTTNTTGPKSCPQSGYQLVSEFNCYKAFPLSAESQTWRGAREQCFRDGGDLMVVETEREREDVYIPLFNSISNPWVGVYIPEDVNAWTTVKGEPAISTWWQPGEPDTNVNRKCASSGPTGLLSNYYCEGYHSFICEIEL